MIKFWQGLHEPPPRLSACRRSLRRTDRSDIFFFSFAYSRSVRKSAEEISWTARVGDEDRVGRRLDGRGGRRDHHDSDHDDGCGRRSRGRGRRRGHRHADRRGLPDGHRRHRSAGRRDRDQRRQCVHIVRRDRDHIASTPDQLRLYGRADQDAASETRRLSRNYYHCCVTLNNAQCHDTLI